MNAQVIELVRGKDRKLYPVGLPRPRAELNRLRTLAHNLHCRDKLSYRQVQRVMHEQYGIRRSLGRIYKDVSDYECPWCAE